MLTVTKPVSVKSYVIRPLILILTYNASLSVCYPHLLLKNFIYFKA
jgi:hypothetical protein